MTDDEVISPSVSNEVEKLGDWWTKRGGPGYPPVFKMLKFVSSSNQKYIKT